MKATPIVPIIEIVEGEVIPSIQVEIECDILYKKKKQQIRAFDVCYYSRIRCESFAYDCVDSTYQSSNCMRRQRTALDMSSSRILACLRIPTRFRDRGLFRCLLRTHRCLRVHMFIDNFSKKITKYTCFCNNSEKNAYYIII